MNDNKHDELVVGLLIFFLAIYTATTLIAWYFRTNMGDIQWWALIIVLAFCHLVLCSLKTIGEQERAVLIFYGLILKEWKSGPHFALWPFYRVRRATKNSIQVDFGTIDEKNTGSIDRVNRSEKSDSWFVMKEPVRINWGDMKSLGLPKDQQEAYANDPYANTLTTDPHIFFRIKISNLKYLIERVGGVDEAIERIKDTCVSSLTEEAGKTFVAKARKEMNELSAKVKKEVEELAGDPEAIKRATNPEEVQNRSWGIDVEDVRIKDIGAPHAANTALAERAAAIAKADGEATATIRTAAATRKKFEEEGVGKAAAVVSAANAEKTRLEQEGKGRASALIATAKAVTKPGGELIIKTDTLRAVMTASGGKIIVVPTDLSSLTGAILGVVEAVKTAGSPSADQTQVPSKK
jgi:regulator of protease activity HflC (stomatin/prohibitin superfamily)